MYRDTIEPLQVQNITGNIKCHLPIPLKLIQHIPRVRISTSKIRCAYVKLSKGSCNVFGSGKVVFLGFTSLEQMNDAVGELKNLLGRFMVVGPKLLVPKIRNVVARFDLCIKINYEAFSEIRKHLMGIKNIVYEPGYSNSVHIHYIDSMRILLHSTGKGFTTGCANLYLMNDRIIDLQNWFLRKHTNSFLYEGKHCELKA